MNYDSRHLSIRCEYSRFNLSINLLLVFTLSSSQVQELEP